MFWRRLRDRAWEPYQDPQRRQQVVVVAILFLALGLGFFFVNVISVNLGVEEQDVDLGATFSLTYAQELGLDWQEAYLATLDELRVRRLRLPAYWSRLEPRPGILDFADLDWQVDEAADRDAEIIMAVGRKLPRWPECHQPSWAANLDEDQLQQETLEIIEAVVRRYRDNPAIVAWQVENEPFFPFGDCPEPDIAFLKQEIALVRSLDSRPIVITESGELSTWFQAANLADILGISTYRVVWSRYVGYFYWPITPKNYQRRALAVRTLVQDIIVSELQAEPWSDRGHVRDMPIDRQLKLMNPERLRSNLSFARRIGLSAAYLWGVEWWYWLKTRGYPEMWEAGRAVLQSAARP